MNDIETAICSHILADEGCLAIIEKRVFPLFLPEKEALPALVYRKISAPRDTDLDGPTGMVQSRIQFDLLARSYKEAKALSKALRQCLFGFSGMMTDVPVHACIMPNETDFFETDTNFYRLSIDFTITHEEE